MCTSSSRNGRRKICSNLAALLMLCASGIVSAGAPFGPNLVPSTDEAGHSEHATTQQKSVVADTPHGARDPDTSDAAALDSPAAIKPDSVPAHERIPLGQPAKADIITTASESPTESLLSWRAGASLAIVLGLVLVLKLVVTRAARSSGSFSSRFGAGGRAPSGVLEVLGRYPVARGITLVLLRLDRRVLLLSQSPEGFSTLAELTEPDDIASILTKTRDDDGESLSSKFTSMLKRFERDHTIIEEPVHIPESPIAAHAPAPLVRAGDISTDDIQTHLARIRELQS